jgi:cupin 2 domain-containing protein
VSTSPLQPANIFAELLLSSAAEHSTTLVDAPAVHVERIVSPPGHGMPANEWYDQTRDEFVLVLQGRGALVFDGQEGEIVLNPGDYLRLPAGVRHRVSWTDAHQPTIWLAVHHDSPHSDSPHS